MASNCEKLGYLTVLWIVLSRMVCCLILMIQEARQKTLTAPLHPSSPGLNQIHSDRIQKLHLIPESAHAVIARSESPHSDLVETQSRY